MKDSTDYDDDKASLSKLIKLVNTTISTANSIMEDQFVSDDTVKAAAAAQNEAEESLKVVSSKEEKVKNDISDLSNTLSTILVTPAEILPK